MDSMYDTSVRICVGWISTASKALAERMVTRGESGESILAERWRLRTNGEGEGGTPKGRGTRMLCASLECVGQDQRLSLVCCVGKYGNHGW